MEAAATSMRKLSFTSVFGGKSHDGVIELSEKLKELSPVPASKVLFGASGSEANDMQVKLTWYYNNARGRPDKKKIIARLRGYHGVTVASGSLTGLPDGAYGFRSADQEYPAYLVPALLSRRPGRRDGR